MTKKIQLNIIDLGGSGTTKGCNCEALDLSAYAKKDDVPKKVSELENDSEFVKNASLGTAAFKNVEDFQGRNMTLVKEDIGEVDSKTYIYLSVSNNKDKMFILSYAVVNYASGGNLLDINGDKIGTFSGSGTVMQELVGLNLFKIIFYADSSYPKVYISDRPISYICLGEYTNVMPTVAAGESDKVTYSIKEYA